jgi:hypothetical protein
MPWYSEPHTDPFWHWTNAWAELLLFEDFVVGLTKRADFVVKTAAEALLKWGPPRPEEGKEALKRQMERGGEVGCRFQHHHAKTLAEMLHCRIVDNFLTYTSELLALVFRSRPETLRSSEQIRLEFVLSHSSMEELLGALADRKVNELSYRGMKDLNRFLVDHMGFELFPEGADLDLAVEAIEMRNLIVHSRGIVSATAVSRVPSLRDLEGRALDCSTETNSKYGLFFEAAVRSVDLGAIEKFGLPTSLMESSSRLDRQERPISPET